MATDLNWQELLDRSIGDGPGHPPMAERLAAGRRALRRRQIAVGVATAVVAVVAGGAVWAAAPAGTGTVAPAPSNPDARPDDRTDGQVADGELVTMTDSGWALAPGWDLEVRYVNPMHYQAPKRSVAMEIVNGSDRRVLLAVYDGDCCTEVHSRPATPGFIHAWLDRAIQAQEARDGTNQPVDAPVHFGAGETLVAAPGVTILEQLPHPDLPRNFAGPNDRSAAAWIEADGERTFVLVRETYGEEQVIPWDKGDFDSLEAFLVFAKQRYESGVGLL